MESVPPRDLTLVTAVGRTEPLLWQRDLAQSLVELARLRPATKVRWVRIIDGPGVEVEEQPFSSPPQNFQSLILPALPGGRAGIAVTRNRAIEHLLDGWVISVDSDDYLKPVETAMQLERTEQAGANWSAALANDIDADNREIYEGPDYFAEGVLAAGVFLEHTLEHDLPPWRCSVTVIDGELIRACGGWATDPRLIRVEDTAMVCRITSALDGLWVPLVVQVYRKHERQTTADPRWYDRPRRLDVLAEYSAGGAWVPPRFASRCLTSGERA
jgi:hypothetical protein